MELVIGRIAKAHGVSGELVVDIRTDDPEARFVTGRRMRLKDSAGVPGATSCWIQCDRTVADSWSDSKV